MAAAAGFIRRRLRIIRAGTFPAVIIVIVAAAIAGMTAPATAEASNPQSAGMAELFKSYVVGTGLIGTSWWEAAVALSTVETYEQTTGDATYDAIIERTFDMYSAGKFENNANDDTAWWALVWLQAYSLTHNPSYLSMAETDADYIAEDWDSTCGGGIWWQRSPKSYKNAITNELFLELTAWLHNSIPGDTKYLAWAKAEWSWFDHSGMINNSDLVNDGLDDSCQNNGQNTWTYNQGVILAGLAQLYRATGNPALLTTAESIAHAAVSDLTVGGVLTEKCDGDGCDGFDSDTPAFKGIFVQDLKVLAVTAGTAEFNAFFARQAGAIETRDTTKRGQLGMYWAGPVAQSTSASQASALSALVASLNLP